MQTTFLAVAAVLISAGIAVEAQPLAVHSQTLTNGMKVLVHQDPSIPNAAVYFFYRVGSRNERPGTTGLSHFFEHMMFNGARKYGPKQFDRVMEGAGGANNAFTDYDITAYQDWCPVTALPLIFDLESDRIAHLAFDPKMVESERGVVASERRVGDGDNPTLLSEQLWAAAFTAHPYQWPVIGWMVDIEHWSMTDLKHHFDIGYSPANAVLVVSGAAKADDVIRLAQQNLEPIPARPCPLPVTTREPEQQGERRVQLVKLAQLPLLMVGYHVPESAHADFHPLRALQQILVFGRSSRLYRRLIDQDQLAIEVRADMSLALDPTLFVITVQARQDANTLAIEKALDAELGRIQRDGVSDSELQKARNILLAEFYHQTSTIDGKSRALGAYEVYFGDYRKLFSTADDLGRINGGDLKRVAQKYFVPKNRTVATLVPEKPDGTP
jgi:zinc protease